MRKIPTLFLRDFEHSHGRLVTREVDPRCAWVTEGLGVATRKLDGTAVLIDHAQQVWTRREVKPGKEQPEGFLLLETDDVTGKRVGWEPYRQSGWAGQVDEALRTMTTRRPATYELIGPAGNGNPERSSTHRLVPHGTVVLGSTPRTYDGLWEFLLLADGWEGIVFWERLHDATGRMAKIKLRDFPR